MLKMITIGIIESNRHLATWNKNGYINPVVHILGELISFNNCGQIALHINLIIINYFLS